MNRFAITAGLGACVLGASVLLPAQGAAEPAATATGNELSGMTVFLDPGHQGSSEGHDLAQQVNDGRGNTKDCQTSGMTSLGGVPEHTINWNVSQLVKSSLESLGAKVVQSRQDDTGWGGCIDERARAASESNADLAVSIHADSTAQGEDASKHGFHMIIPSLPIPDEKADAAQSGGGLEASKMMRDAYKSDGFVPANYAGVNDGLQTRADVAGPALTQVPLVFVEMGNGSNKEDAAQLESSDGQLKHAITITTGIVTYLLTGSGSTPSEDLAAAPADTATTEVSEDSASSATTTTPKATTPKASPKSTDPKSTAPDSAQFTELMKMLEPLLEVNGLDGLQDLVNDKNLGLVSDLASTLMAVLTGAGGN
ncbi:MULTISPECIES: N-acetylmuramoyl-L-alanine amidase [unclassified Rhodococcus (in: high G+C Gram-positive bacteria)]|uniref:N-acetylmuramoyl-L-alanine amidase n=1 Tax=unclassified Rhodococcus (in: high G+C Gram-positive bacteria) TaxID=192944 RepID=UPI00163B07DF|nr:MULTISPECIES: N-acetylmuramoyl-L-alanine amidase [unclassified Rhodococcus (in: high G+C Gram-positive bacteria)]MBC2642845.1 N-acetylmuramoyl-L-alanine amidase [Rhodococcus sp. 3A]MBC2892413.1 N-acetylmuramoyl-L-alanine amidase [Rhodococcus sp. 4CII]